MLTQTETDRCLADTIDDEEGVDAGVNSEDDEDLVEEEEDEEDEEGENDY